MSWNFNRWNPIPPLGNDSHMFHSSSSPDSSSSLNHTIWDGNYGLNFDSNLGNTQLLSHRVMEVTKTFVSPLGLLLHQQLFRHSIHHVSRHNPHAAFPIITRQITVETTRFNIASTEIINRGFDPNQPIFPAAGLTQPAAVRNSNDFQMMHPFPEAFNVPNHIETDHFDAAPFGDDVELSDDENDAAVEYPFGDDGRTHSLPNPDGTYGCPICFAAFDSCQSFGSHIQLHYHNDETKEEKSRRMAAKCRKKKLRLVETSHGITAVPAYNNDDQPNSSKRRKNNKGKEKIDVSCFEKFGLSPLNIHQGAAAKKRSRGVVIKQEPI
ncbi:hypothetical protein COLO4_10408 [Corchorus olitorius]|uniref:C2H2-type domain-containing protein n=1 Tax=Corchorus olitorius TaxID=93759 RepID=A0A1R3K8P3_9ROSI|nr:hypothetical protein COLO4_10408 [Corchorus olitorius]